MNDHSVSVPWVRRLSHAELALRRRYEIISILNDMLVAAWFIVGSVLFFSDKTETLGTWLFLAGSIELAIRPAIRLTRYLHLRHRWPAGAHESQQDF